jgi:signal transduction histidine kinase
MKVKGASRSWPGTPRGLLAAFLALTLGPALALLWAGWRMIEKDRAGLVQAVAERREAAADEAVTLLRENLSSLLGRLQELSLEEGADAAVAEFAPGGVRRRSGRLLFVPAVNEPPAPRSDVLADADRLEFAEGNTARAVALLEPLARSRDPRIRAECQLRLARNYRKRGRAEAALAAYARLGQERGVRLDGVPAELVAQRAHCALLAELEREEELRRESCALLARLHAGRWPVSHAVYRVHEQDATAWCGEGSTPDLEAESLSEAVGWLWERLGPGPSASGWDSTLQGGGRLVTVVWKPLVDRALVLAAGPGYLDRHWSAALQPLGRLRGVSVGLLGPAEAAPPGASVRLAAATNLPWTLSVASVTPERELQEFGARRRLLLAALVLAALAVVAATFFTARTLSREVALLQLQSDFVAAVSHEFRTPLTALRNLSEMFTDGRALDEETRGRYYQVLARATGRLERLVEGLLGFGRMEAGLDVYDMQPLDPAVAAREIAEEFRPEAAAEGYELEVSVAAGLPSIRADREALGRALRNLLENAVRYSPGCRTVWLDVAREGARVAFRVRDRGYGTPPRERRAIFRKFVRGEAARAAGIKGTGVGLTIVSRVVEAHSGELRIDSRVGEGSTFTLLLPGMEDIRDEGARR